MSDIIQIRARIETADVDRAATDAWIYLGIAGREFCLDPGSGKGYFERGVKTCFVLGEQGGSDGGEAGFNNVPVEDPEYNDPRTPSSTPTTSTWPPAYIRFSSAGSNPGWCVERVKVTVDNLRLREKKDNRQLGLHERYGERLFLYNVTSD
ncbi:hypothetical protein ACGF3J_37620 [Streptomyces sp. NPDC048171]|uniref:hypothetical protein n=1 Tax=Streptomyces sp. NPDC048171 TaxID=3365504 RepID=UPI00371B6E71